MTFCLRRREFIAGLGGAVVSWPLAARAQQPESVPRVAFLTGLSAEDPEGEARLAAFLHGLAERGWRIGRNLQMEYRAAGRDSDRYRQYAQELLRLRPDVAVASGAPARGAAKCNDP